MCSTRDRWDSKPWPSAARPGDVVAVQGIGGLGHLGVQYARRMGFKTVALGRGKDKGPLAEQLGAHQYVDSNVADPVAELQKLGQLMRTDVPAFNQLVRDQNIPAVVVKPASSNP